MHFDRLGKYQAARDRRGAVPENRFVDQAGFQDAAASQPFAVFIRISNRKNLLFREWRAKNHASSYCGGCQVSVGQIGPAFNIVKYYTVTMRDYCPESSKIKVLKMLDLEKKSSMILFQ